MSWTIILILIVLVAVIAGARQSVLELGDYAFRRAETLLAFCRRIVG